MALVPHDLLRYSLRGAEVVPHYLSEIDHPWLRALLDEYRRFEGKARRLLSQRLEEPLPAATPGDKLRIARHVLDRTWRYRCGALVPPARARAALFGHAARVVDRDEALARAADELGMSPAALLDALFADLPPNKVLVAPKEPISPAQLAQRANLALVGGMLRRASLVRITAAGNVRPLVRQAKLRGLLCTVRPDGARPAAQRWRAWSAPAAQRWRESSAPGGGALCSLRPATRPPEHAAGGQIEISGPFALFRRTLLYGRALASLVPFAARCDRMELRAACALQDGAEPRTLVIRSGDPLFPAPPERRYDSKLEARFARAFARAAPEWDVVREPEPVAAEGTLIFPDFELRHRRDRARRWLLEIMGFWTPAYVQNKLRRLRAADLSRFILCIDEERRCTADELPARAHVIRYRRRIEVERVLRIVAPERAHPLAVGAGARGAARGAAARTRRSSRDDPGPLQPNVDQTVRPD